jgi:hypothetical protein
MRPRSIQGVPGLDPNGTPFERLRQFAGRIVRISKIEVDKESQQPVSAKRGVGGKPKRSK